MSNSIDGRGLAADEFDDDEIDWDNDGGPSEGDGISPLEELADEGSDLFEDDAEEPDDRD
ncbi:MAG TPA: hypothetical protein VGF80_08415 [Galbitalea sp.]|jgi:hypothetical protein